MKILLSLFPFVHMLVASILWRGTIISAFVPTTYQSHQIQLFATTSLPEDEKLKELLQVAVAASKKAGEIILKYTDGADVVETKSTSRDLLTTVDPQCEKVR